MENFRPRDLRPCESGEHASQHKKGGHCDHPNPAEPKAVAAAVKDQLGQMNRREDDKDALINQGPQQIDVIHAKGTAIDPVFELK